MMTPTLAFSSLAAAEWGLLAVAFLSVAFGCFTLGKSRGARQQPEPVKSAPLPTTAQSAPNTDAAVLTFLGVLQEKGRLIDFLMDDVTAYSDAQVGAAARVVHQGCQSALKEHLSVEPIASEAEGASISLPEGYSAGDYRLSGNVSGEPPYNGVLVHKGWRAADVRLPRTIASVDGTEAALPLLAPAQVEVS